MIRSRQREQRRETREQAAGRRALFLQFTNPAAYPPLEHSSHILADAGWTVRLLGQAVAGVEALHFPAHPAIRCTMLPAQAPGWRQKLQYLRFCVEALRLALAWRPSLIYASDPLACPAALLLSALPGLRVIYHEHDSPGPAASAMQRFVLGCRRLLGRRAALRILPNAGRAARFQAEVGDNRPVLTVWNCPRRSELLPIPRPPRSAELLVLYQGSVVPERLPLATIQALALLPPAVRLRVVGYETVGSSGYLAQLRATAAEVGVAERLELVGERPRAAVLTHCRAADVGLALMPMRSDDPNLAHMPGASNKVFDYLCAGTPLLVSDLPAWREQYVEPGYGLACRPDDPASIAQGLRWYLDHPAELHAMGERGRQRTHDDWNYERQFAPVLKEIGLW